MAYLFLRNTSLETSSKTRNSTIELRETFSRCKHGQICLSLHASGRFISSQNVALSFISSGCVRRENGGKVNEMLLMPPTKSAFLTSAKKWENVKKYF